jgi:hypothetical protein
MEGRNIMAESQKFYTRVPLMPLNSNPEKMKVTDMGENKQTFLRDTFVNYT